MRCMTCSADIPPQWVAAIQANKCPGCDGEIMNSTVQELLTELTSAMERMPNNPQGIAGWLVSNYEFRKIGDAAPTEHFHQKPPQGMVRDNSVPSGFRVAENPVQAMLKRTGQMKNIQATNSKLQQMAKGIVDVENEENLIQADQPAMDDVEMGDEIVAEETYPLEEERGPKLSRHLINGELVDPSAQPLTPEELAVIGSLGGGGEDDVVAQEADAQRALQMQRLKRVRAQQGVAGGGGVGVFRRSS